MELLEKLVTTVFDKAREVERERRMAEEEQEASTTDSLAQLVEALSKSHNKQLTFAKKSQG